MLEARLLGRFDVRVDGAVVEIPSRPAQSLFAYLLLNAGVSHRRERLAGLLWPESSEESARSNLRHALWRVRRSLEAAGSGEWLVADDLGITFDRQSPHRTDVAVLQAERKGAESAAALRERVSAYGGELLPGFHDEWVVLERERLRGIFDRAMQQLLDQLVRDESWAAVAEWGEQWISVGQSPEPAFRALMVAAASSGDVAGVVSAYRRCVDALKADLGVDPSQQTQAMYQELSKGASPVRSSVVSAAAVRLAGVERETSPVPGDPPYKGMRYFDAVDAIRFFGREELVQRIVSRVHERRFVAVIGASGTGKSSLVRAGVVPALLDSVASGSECRAYVFTPTAKPLESLAVALTRGNGPSAAAASIIDGLSEDVRTLRLAIATATRSDVDTLLVVDQFEEIFTECEDESERTSFIDNLLAASGRHGPAMVIITLRADFYGQCARYAGLRDVLAADQEYIGPMNPPELRRAIEEPARQGGWEFEPGLVDLILRDAGDEPGSLPLLSHALLETWQRRSGRALTLRSYAESGGVHGAIARTAETVYNQRLTPEEREVAKAIFLRLAAFGDTAQSARRRVSVGELVQNAAGRSSVERVLRILADARLVSIGADSVEVAHEALFREWPTLHRWLNEDRDALRIHGHLSLAAQEWDETGREGGDLYRGARLSQADEWATTRGEQMNTLEREFMGASIESARSETAEHEEAQRRELAAARRVAEAERSHALEQRRFALEMRTRAFALAGAFVLAVVLAGIALVLGEQARMSALATQVVARTAISRELAAAALAQLDIDPERSVLLALQAVAATYPGDGRWTAEAESALHRAIGASRLELRLVGHTGPIEDVAFSRDGKRLVTASWDGTARVWDAATGAELMKLEPSSTASGLLALDRQLGLSPHAPDELRAASFSPDGMLIATSSGNLVGQPGAPRLWDAVTGRELRTLEGHVDESGLMRDVNAIVFSSDGTRVYTASNDRTARVWDTATGRLLLTLSGGHTRGIRALALAPDGKRLVTGSADETARVWDLSTGEQVLVLRGHKGILFGVAYSPDGERIATVGGEDRTAKVWDARSGRELVTFADHRGILVGGIAFSPDGASLITASASGETKVWDPATGREKFNLVGHSSAVRGVAYSTDGMRIASVGGDGIGRIWKTGPDQELLTIAAERAGVAAVAFDGGGLRVAGALTDSSARVWDARTGVEQARFEGHKDQVLSIAWSPDGALLVTGSRDATAKIWDARTGRELFTLSGHGPPAQAPTPWSGVPGVAFSSDGAHVATAGADGTARIWDAKTGRQQVLVRPHNANNNLMSVSFSPNGMLLVAGSSDPYAAIWDVASGRELGRFSSRGIGLSAAFSPDGRRLATAGSAEVRVSDVASGAQLFVIQAHVGFIPTVAYSHDGGSLATAGDDGYVRLWDATDGRPLLSLGNGLSTYTGVALSQDGKVMAASATDGTVRLYLTRIGDLLELARSRVTRSLTPEECLTFMHRQTCP